MSASLPLITTKQARRTFMVRQGLCHPPDKCQDKDALHGLIHQLGFVQVDSIRTVERAHHMILFTRNQTYRREHLRQLLEDDRRLFEHWTHDASIIPSEFYPHWQGRFARREAQLRERWRKIRPKGRLKGKTIAFEDVLDQVRVHVSQNGPTLSRDLKMWCQSQKAKKNGWWEWHPAKTALEFLWRTGEFSICHRNGFQKAYDLCHRVIPDKAMSALAQSGEGFIDWACNNALDRLGFATSGELAAYWASVDAAEARTWCARSLGDGIIEVLVEDASGGPPRRAFARPALLDQLSDILDPPNRLRVLSPFDPLIRDRKRLKRLFDFEYRIEIFVPKAKRKFGYYVFPLLERDRLIGRVDMKARRDDDVLCVTGLWLEPKVKFTKIRRAGLAAELNRQAKFIGMGRVVWEPGFLKT